MTTTAPAPIPAESTTKTPAKKAAPKKAAPKKASAVKRTVADALDTGGKTVELPPGKPTSPTTGRQLVSLPLDLIVDSPDNPRADVGDVSGLAASIQSAGLLEPVLVTPAEAYRAGNNQLPDAKDAGRYVLIAGHRRVAACRSIKLTHVDAIVEDRVGVEARKAMIIENFQRVDLTPLEEAKAFAELQELGLKQDDMATQVGCSQSHISKRLGLLKLDPKVQDAVIKKELPIADALELGKLDEHGRQAAALEQMSKYRWSAEQAVRQQQEKKKTDEAIAKHRKMLKEKKIEEAKNLQSLFGHSQWQYVLTGEELKRHQGKKPGEQLDCLVASITEYNGRLEYYCKAKKRCAAYPKSTNADGSTSKLSAEERQKRADNKERKAAAVARAESAAALATIHVPESRLASELVAFTAAAHFHPWEKARYRAAEWLGASKYPTLAKYATSTYGLEDALAKLDDADKATRLFVRAALLALAENDLQEKWVPLASAFGPRGVRYLAELVQRTGYAPTAWELAQVKKHGKVTGDALQHLTTLAIA